DGGLLAEAREGEAAGAEDAVLAVEEGDRALGGGGVHERGIERDEAGFRAQVGDVDSLLALRALDHLQFHLLLACDDADGLRHGLSFALFACATLSRAVWQKSQERSRASSSPTSDGVSQR